MKHPKDKDGKLIEIYQTYLYKDKEFFVTCINGSIHKNEIIGIYQFMSKTDIVSFSETKYFKKIRIISGYKPIKKCLNCDFKYMNTECCPKCGSLKSEKINQKE